MRSTFRGEHLPPGPRGHWLAGNLGAYEQDRLGFLLRLRDRYGPMVRFGAHTTLLSDAAIAEGLLRDRTGSFEVRENFLQKPISAGQSRAVLELRAALSPGLRRRASHSIAPLVERRLMSGLAGLDGPARRSFDPLPLLETALSSAVAEFYFGPEDATDVAGQVRALLDDLSRVIGNPFALPPSWGSPLRRRIDVKHRDLQTRVVALLRVRERSAKDDLAGDIVTRVDGRFPREQVADMVIGSLLAAQRVPAAGASWLLMLLADHPDIQRSVRTRSAATPIVRQVVLESLRLFPPTWLIVRTSTRPVTVGEFAFPAGHHFMISPYVLHRDPRHYDEPDEFRPQRWDCVPQTAPGFLPFGSGLHGCPGRHLASVLMSTIATSITARHSIVRTSGRITPNPRTTLLPDGLRIRLLPTSSDAGQTSSQPDGGDQLLLAESSPF